MTISEFTLESLGLKGNYSVMINYYESNERSKFIEFLSTRSIQDHESQEAEVSEILPKKVSQRSNPTVPSVINEILPQKTIIGYDTTFKIFRPSRQPISTRTYTYIIS